MRATTVQSLTLCLVFAVVFVVCLVPIVVLYILFGTVNYFGLEGAWKGVVGSGPVAAYVFLYIYSLRYVLKFLKLGGALMAEDKVRKLEEGEAVATDVPIEIPKVAGAWVGNWSWLDESTGKTSTYTESVEIEQQGREITGSIKDDRGQESVFRGSIFARMVTFYFVSRRQSRLSCGSVTVKVSADGGHMNGYQIYYDLELEKLVSTAYRLEPRK